MNFIHSTLDALRDRYAPVSHTSNFRSTGQITPEEFVAAGDFLVYKFPSWSWSDASSPSRRVSYLPDGKQFLITRGVPCHRRLDDNFAGDAGTEDAVIKDGFGGGDSAAAGEDGEDEGWLRTGGGTVEHAKVGDVRTLDGSGNVGETEEVDDEDEIPDMEDEEDEDAIIRDHGANKAPLRTYTLYITYTPYYRTPRLYLSGYLSPSEPLPPRDMMQDIVGDYKDKTVTLEDFPFSDPFISLKTASVHPCKHASVMKVLLDRADAALKLRRERIAAGSSRSTHVTSGMEGLVDETRNMNISSSGGSPSRDPGFKAGVAAAGGAGGDEWEVLGSESAVAMADESAIRVDQYLVVFLKFMAGLMPGIQYDFTTGV